jgi:hypothetical protein
MSAEQLKMLKTITEQNRRVQPVAHGSSHFDLDTSNGSF